MIWPMWSEAILITIYPACETSLVTCEHRYTLPTVAPLVLASAGVVGDVSRPPLLPHMLYMQHARIDELPCTLQFECGGLLSRFKLSKVCLKCFLIFTSPCSIFKCHCLCSFGKLGLCAGCFSLLPCYNVVTLESWG
jgi:hypothetical protein